MANFLVSHNLGGISNRIKCLVSMWRAGDFFDRKVLLFWPRNDRCGAKFGDLFENEVKEISKQEFKKIKNRNHIYYGDKEISDFKNSDHKYLLSDSWRFITLPGEIPHGFAKEYPTYKGNNIDHEFERIPKKIREKFLPYIKKLRPINSIQKKVDVFSKKFDLSQFIGLHVRRGDFISSKDGSEKIYTNKKFFNKMKIILKDNKKSKFFLCADDPEVEREFRKEFGNKILTYKKTSFDRLDIRATQEGLIDLLLLSKTKHIIGTYMSTFTEMAWWFGECNAKVEFLVSEKDKEEIKRRRNQKNPVTLFKKFVLENILNKRPPFY